MNVKCDWKEENANTGRVQKQACSEAVGYRAKSWQGNVQITRAKCKR